MVQGKDEAGRKQLMLYNIFAERYERRFLKKILDGEESK